MKCLLRYNWVKLPRNCLPKGKGVMGSWAKLASRAAYRAGKARYCGHINSVQAGAWAGGVVGLKAILGIKGRDKALGALHTLSELGYITYTSMKTISDKYSLTDEQLTQARGELQMTAGDGSTITGNVISNLYGRSRFGAMDVSSMGATNLFGMGTGEFNVFPGLTEMAWRPAGMLGINANTEVPELAANFLSNIYSDAVQSAVAGGLPVTKGGTDAQIAAQDRQARATGSSFSFDMQGLLDQIKTPAIPDDFVGDSLMDTAKSYCAGEIDLDGAVKKTEQELKNYLAERN